MVVGASAYGVVLRLWLLAHLAFQSDEAVVGLMGRQILDGHPTVFYWGSFYGGIEAYAVAPAMWVFGSTPTVVNATPAVLAALAAGVVGIVVVVAGGGRRLAALAATLVWVWPFAAVFNSVRELGLRGVALLCGLVLVLCTLAIFEGRRHLALFAVLGLVGGLGWWASPEIVYFLVPGGVLLLVSWSRLFEPRARRARWRPVPVVVALAGAVVGALPWLDANLRSGFTSLHSGALGSSGIGYGGRLRDFFAHVLPTQLGLQGVPDGQWVGGGTLGPVLFAFVLVLVAAGLGAAAWQVRRQGRAAAPVGAVALGVVVFPFLYAVFPNAGYWTDGRYGVYLPPPLALLWALALAGALRQPVAPRRDAAHRPRRHALGRPRTAPVAVAVTACLGVVGATVLTAGVARTERVPATPSAFFSGWSSADPNRLAAGAATGLEAAHIRHAYATYWVAYVIDFLTHDRVVLTPTLPDDPRNVDLYNEVVGSTHPAYLFYAQGREGQATFAFANAEPGPAGMSEAAFTASLRRRGVPYRVVHTGLLDAVVPERPVAPPA